MTKPKAKDSCRKIRKPARAAKRPLSANPVPQFSASTEPTDQIPAHSCSEQAQTLSNRAVRCPTKRMLAECHADLVGDLAYICLSNSIFKGSEFSEAAGLAPLFFQQQMCPKDPLERLALAQALLAHTRAAWLTTLATAQTNAIALRDICEACDRSSATFGRLLRAISEYRQPKIPGTTVSIGQANLAHQQIVKIVQKLECREEKSDEQTRIEEGASTRRSYRLSKRGLHSLRVAIRRTEPWKMSTGPKGAQEKARVAMNALKHGERSAIIAETRRAARTTIERLKVGSDG